MIRSFIALPLPDAARARLEVLQHMLPLATRVPPENFHLTLAFLDSQPGAVLEAVHDGLMAVKAPPLVLTIAGLAIFASPAPRLIHAEIAADPALDRLQARVSRIAMSAGVPLRRRRFQPHVTLSRDRPRGAELARLEHALASLPELGIDPFPVTEMILYRSTLRPRGALHEPLAHYPLVG